MKMEEPSASKVVLFRCKIQKTCKRTVEICKWLLDFVSNEYMTQKMCKRTVFVQPYAFVCGYYKTKEMCERALDHNQKLLRFFPNCFVTTRILDNFDNDDLIAWYISTQRRELLSITLSVTLQCLLSFKYLFLYFLYKYSRFLHFHMIPAALLLIASYFSF